MAGSGISRASLAKDAGEEIEKAGVWYWLFAMKKCSQESNIKII